MVKLTDDCKFELAKTFTICAIENGFIVRSENPSDTAKEVNEFFKTVFNHIDDD